MNMTTITRRSTPRRVEGRHHRVAEDEEPPLAARRHHLLSHAEDVAQVLDLMIMTMMSTMRTILLLLGDHHRRRHHHQLVVAQAVVARLLVVKIGSFRTIDLLPVVVHLHPPPSLVVFRPFAIECQIPTRSRILSSVLQRQLRNAQLNSRPTSTAK
jgi:hypothetical protein